MGALVMAGVACGQLASLEAATAALVAPGDTFAPDPATAGPSDARFEQFKALYHGLKPIHHDMHG